jgi:hypothetical protein
MARLFRLPLIALFLTSGCIKSALINGQIEGTRQASSAFDTIGDLELAEAAAASGIVQFEGMHELSPDNTDALFLLVKGWTGYAFGFAEDEMERAEDDGDRSGAEYHKKRAIAGYDRALKYGLELLAHRAQGFEEAKAGEATLKAWLEQSFTKTDDAANLFWTAYAWIARTNLMKDDAEAVANLYVGVAIMERAVALDPAYNNWSGLVVLAAYHARAAAAELDEAKKLFDQALEKTERKSLIVQFNYATKYACARADNVLYGKLLNEVLTTEDKDENLRLTNAIARRRAQRWLAEKRMFDACSMDPAPAVSVLEVK